MKRRSTTAPTISATTGITTATAMTPLKVPLLLADALRPRLPAVGLRVGPNVTAGVGDTLATVGAAVVLTGDPVDGAVVGSAVGESVGGGRHKMLLPVPVTLQDAVGLQELFANIALSPKPSAS